MPLTAGLEPPGIMWSLLTLLAAAAAVGIHLHWSRRLREARRAEAGLREELDALRKAITESAARAEAGQQAIFDSMVEGILMLDSQGRVRTLNHAIERLFGVTREDLIGRTLMEGLRMHEVAHVAARARVEGTVRGFELTLPGIHHNRYLEVNAAAVSDAGGGIEGVILIFHDYSRIRQLEDMRKEFVANVSHELRTPLTLIKGCVETLIDGALEDAEASRRFLHTVQKHADRLTLLIEDLIELSYLDSGQVSIRREVTALAPIADKVLDALQKPACDKGITLHNRIERSLKASMDSDRIHQVLHNLVDNAIKYGRASGTVIIEADNHPDSVVVRVCDDGPGIPEAARERVFERFYRVDRARSREQGGTGLGLSIVKHIVQAHGGRVWVESELHVGSRFHFSLPHGGGPG